MKILNLLFSLSLLTASSAHAALEFTLPCKDMEGKPVAFTAVKVPFRNAEKKWDARYYIEHGGQRYEMISAQTGDEDYTDYRITNGARIEYLYGSIQWRFQWVTVSKDNGDYLRCAKD